MKITQPHQLYHIYNRGNNRQKIFYTRDNYLYFLGKVRTYVRPHCDIIAYSLMPNHFHFLVYSSEKTLIKSDHKAGFVEQTVFSEGWKNLLSSYTKAINKQEKRTGSLFTQNTNSKMVSDEWMSWDYRQCCFSYIHRNPRAARLVEQSEAWEYSSYRDYLGLRNGTLCNIPLGFELMGFDKTYLAEIMSKEWDGKIETAFGRDVCHA